MADAAAAVQNCRLFDIPRELRDEIYELVVVQNKEVDINSKGVPHPALLSACKIIFAEAAPIFYSKNAFAVEVKSWNSSNLVKFAKHLKKLPFKCGVTYGPEFKNKRPDFQNLFKWLSRFHRSEHAVGYFSPQELLDQGRTELSDMIVGGMFAQVDSLRRIPWSDVRKALIVQRPLLVVCDQRWAEGCVADNEGEEELAEGEDGKLIGKDGEDAE